MPNNSNMMVNLSVLFRNTQKYYDHVLSKYGLGAGQLMYLLFINEKEGVTMQEVTRLGEMDKGTTTKAISRLTEEGYIRSVVDEKDRRVRHLYCTEKAAGIMPEIYELRNRCRNAIAKDMDYDAFENMLALAAENSRSGLNIEQEYSGLKIGGLQKMTLLDYPGKVATTIFMAGCTFKCPFCHNRDLVFIPEHYEFMDPRTVLDYLKKRSGILDAVCVSGGEPLMQKDLIPFLEKIKELGYAIKLDTNGSFPKQLKELVDRNLIDYVAMDIKNIPEKYAETLGVASEAFNIRPVRETMKYLLEDHVDYEFRTTVVKEFHEEGDLFAIAKWIKGAKRYYLQPFVEAKTCIQAGLHSYEKEEMETFLKTVQKYIPEAKLRGFKEG